MTLPTIHPKSSILLKTEPLTPAAFAPFGTVITSPLPQSLTSFPSSPPTPLYPTHQPQPVPANQSTALKTSPISPLTNKYPVATIGQDQVNPGTGLMSIFSSFPRRNVYLSASAVGASTDTGNHTPKLKLGILERHPYTTQTFCPFNYSVSVKGEQQQSQTVPNQSTFTPASPASPSGGTDKTYILIIVAPTVPDPASHQHLANPPDLPRLRAFIHPLNDPDSGTPNVAITYNPATWHAPMIVLGSRRVDFLVTQFANGVAKDDCEEVLVGSGPDESSLSGTVRTERRKRGEQKEVEVDLGGLKGVKVDGEGSWDEELEEGKWTTDEAVLRAVRASKL